MNYKIFLIVMAFMAVAIMPAKAQNVTVTDDESYDAHSSAMLDVKANDKGVLVPRVSTSELLLIEDPANGLLVYDTSLNQFMFFNGSKWKALGTSLPSTDGSLFAITNAQGDTVFAVYNDGVEIQVPTSGGKGQVNGFAVSGRDGKSTEDILRVTPSRTSINYDATLGKGQVNGFAVSGRDGTKAGNQPIFSTGFDSTRIYVDQSNKGQVNGFAVSGRDGTKEGASSFLDLTPDNYFIGHQAGSNITEGQYNSTMGYQAGAALTEGTHNLFVGYKAGAATTKGNQNIYLGARAGINNAGNGNVFIGHEAGATQEALSDAFILENSNAGKAEALIYGDFANDSLRLNASVGIGQAPDPEYRLSVNGKIAATGDLVQLKSASKKPDYVFDKEYKRMSIDEVESYISKNNSLPWVTPAHKEENGLNISRMALETLEAVENMQLQLIDVKKENKALRKQNDKLKKQTRKIEQLEEQNEALQKEIREIKEMLRTNR